MSSVEKIKKILLARKMRVFLIEDDYIEVFWRKGDKIKFGRLDKTYTHRYGVSTILTVTEGKRDYWFTHRGFLTSLDGEIQHHLNMGTWKNLEPFTLDLLTSIKF